MVTTKYVLCIPSGVVVCDAKQAHNFRRTGPVFAEGILYPNEREAAVFGDAKYIAIVQEFVQDEFTVY